MKFAHIACVALASLSMAGCANLNAVNYTRDFTNGRSAVMDSDQRVIVTNGRAPSDEDKPIVCAEPSPDTMSLVSVGGSGGVSGRSAAAAEAAIAMSESGSYFGLRTPSIQLLRDGSYRLCEAYMNRAIGPIAFGDNLRQYQRMTVALLAVEQLTGVVRAPPVTLHSGGASALRSGSVLPAIERLEGQLQDLRTEKGTLDAQIKTKNAELTELKTKDDDASKARAKTLTEEIAALEARSSALAATITSREATLKELQKQVGGAQAYASTTIGAAEIGDVQDQRLDAASLVAISSTVKDIVTTAMTRDRFVGVCFDFMMRADQNDVRSGQPGLTATHVESANPLVRAEAERLSALGGTYLACEAIIRNEAGLPRR